MRFGRGAQESISDLFHFGLNLAGLAHLLGRILQAVLASVAGAAVLARLGDRGGDVNDDFVETINEPACGLSSVDWGVGECSEVVLEFGLLRLEELG